MRIAFFSKDLPSNAPNGVSIQVHRLGNVLAARGHEVTCFSFSPRPADAGYDVRQISRNTGSRLMRKFIPALEFRRIPVEDFDILHYHGDDYLCRGSARRVRTFYGSALAEALSAKKISRLAYQAVFYFFELVSCCRRGAKRGISRTTIRCLPLVKSYIPCGVDLSRYSPGGEKTPFPSILFIGDLDSRKRGRCLVDAFTRCVRKKYSDARLVVVGPQPCAGEGVEYAGRIEEESLVGYYRGAWVVCIPSRYEGFGVPAIEAMACGTVVVAADNSGMREIITNGHDGILCPIKDLGCELIRILEDDRLRLELARNGFETAGRYDIEMTASRYAELYRSLKNEC